MWPIGMLTLVQIKIYNQFATRGQNVDKMYGFIIERILFNGD